MPGDLFIVEWIVCRNEMLRDRRLIYFTETLRCSSH